MMVSVSGLRIWPFLLFNWSLFWGGGARITISWGLHGDPVFIETIIRHTLPTNLN